MAGASSGLAFSRYAIGLLDLSYMPLGGNTLQRYPERVGIKDSGLFDLNLSVNIRIPWRKHWEPYGIAGAAVLFSTYQVGPAIYRSRSDTDLGFETGGGLRYYVTENWGARTEVRYTICNRNFGRVLAGVFYQFERDDFFRLGRKMLRQ